MILASKQISTPIARAIKDKAKKYPLFRDYVCMPPAHAYNYIETKMESLNLGKHITVQPLTDETAVELGAHLLGEFVIFSIGATLVLYEYAKQLFNEEKKRAKIKQEKEDLAQKLTDMASLLERQESEIKEMMLILADIAKDRVDRSFLSQKLKENKQNESEIKNPIKV